MAGRKAKKANEEINVVRACMDNYTEKRNKLDEQMSLIQNEIEVCTEKIRLGTDTRELDRLADRILALQDNLKILDMEQTTISGIINVFDKLINLLEQFMLQEQYMYIIKTIPEKKLPKMVKDPKKIKDVYGIVTKLLEAFHEAWRRHSLAREKYKEDSERMEETTTKWEEIHPDSRAEDKAKLIAGIKGTTEEKEKTDDTPKKHYS